LEYKKGKEIMVEYICPKCKDTDNQTKYFPKSYYEYMGWDYIDNYCFDCDIKKIEREENNDTRR
jgi:hypothetical protein